MGDLEQARGFALSLPAFTEEPHFDMASFRVRGKIFATVPPGGEYLHVFVAEEEIRAAVAEDPAAFEAVADDRVAERLEESWRRKAPARLAAEWDQAHCGPAG